MKTNRYYTFLILLIIIIQSCNKTGIENSNSKKETNPEASLDVDDPLNYVNPFLGTAPLTDSTFIGYNPPKDWRVWAGLTFPGSSLPNAMVQLSPITKYGSGAGYEYEDEAILGFAHTNKGHWNLCNIPVLPISGQGKSFKKARFDKSTEVASPAYYEVTLTEFNIKARLTSTLRCGFHEYNYKDNSDRKIIFDLGRANGRVTEWDITKVSNNELQGFQNVNNKEKIYFFAQTSDKIKTVEKISNEKGDDYSLVDFGKGLSKLTLKIGISFVSEANAKQNLLSEIGNKDFNSVHKSGREEWKKILDKVKVSGGSNRQKTLFYSCLYRSFLWPALRSDIDGSFMDEQGKLRNDGFDYYTNPSLWDTYRNKLVLLGMLRPEKTGNVIQSMIVRGEPSGFMPTFFHGDHAAPFIVNAYSQGIKNFDLEKAYNLLLNNAYKEGGTRPYISEYIKLGYVPERDIENPETETVGTAGVSKTLEYAYDDHSLAKLAMAVNDMFHMNDLTERAKNYKNVVDPKSQFMRGRLADGSWIAPFNSEYPYYEYMYREANSWQVSFYVPHDMPGLIQEYSSKDRFEEKLDSLFSYSWNPKYIARNISSFMGQYCHGNQPDHEAPFSYYFVDKPEKSQTILDRILEDFYGVGNSGLALSGMDDAGEMSAWYVFAASGIYPFSPADNEYIISIPLFDQIEWTINNNKFIINKTDRPNVRHIKLNNSVLDSYFLNFEDFKKGGNLIIGQ